MALERVEGLLRATSEGRKRYVARAARSYAAELVHVVVFVPSTPLDSFRRAANRGRPAVHAATVT